MALGVEGSNKLIIIIDNNNKRIFQSNSGQKFNFHEIHFRNTTKRQHPCLLNHGFSMRWPPLRVIGFWHSKVQRGGRTCNLLDDLDLQQKVINPCNNICSSQGVASFKKWTTLIHKKQAAMKRVYFLYHSEHAVSKWQRIKPYVSLVSRHDSEFFVIQTQKEMWLWIKSEFETNLFFLDSTSRTRIITIDIANKKVMQMLFYIHLIMMSGKVDFCKR